MQHLEPHQALRLWWAKTGNKVTSRPSKEAEICALEERYDVRLPADFRDYLVHSVPAAENWDQELGNWWPLAQIKNIPDEYEHTVAEPIGSTAGKHMFFVDHSIWCWAWAISCANDETYGKVAVIAGGEHDRYVADSFAEFVDRYINDWGFLC